MLSLTDVFMGVSTLILLTSTLGDRQIKAIFEGEDREI